MPEPKHDTLGRLIAKVTWELLGREHFTTIADLTDALKYRCRQLRIGWTNDAIADAYRLIETNTPLTWPSGRRPNAAGRRTPPAITAAEAAILLNAIRTRTGADAPIKTL